MVNLPYTAHFQQEYNLLKPVKTGDNLTHQSRGVHAFGPVNFATLRVEPFQTNSNVWFSMGSKYAKKINRIYVNINNLSVHQKWDPTKMMEIWAHVMAPLWFSMRKNDSVGLKLNTRVVTRMRISKFWEIQSHHSCWGYFRVVACDIWLEPSPRSITKLEDFPEYMPHQPWVPIRRATQTSDSSRFRVSGFGFRVSGFGFRVSGFVAWNQLSLSVSGFGFRRLKPTFAVGFGFRSALGKLSLQSRFRVSGFVAWNQLSLSVSGFGFRRLKPTFAVGFGFRVSISPGEVKSSESISGFGFRVSIGPGEGQSSESVSGFGFRVSIGPGEGKSSESVSGFGFRSVLGKLSLQSRFRVSGFVVRNQL